MPAETAAGGGARTPPKPSGAPRTGANGERAIKRSTFTPDQLSVLESAFAVNPLPALAMRHSLAEQLGLTPRTVQVWFQNRRQKMKKLQVAAGGSTSNESSAERDAMLALGDSPSGGTGMTGMTRNSSTASFELLNAEFERLNRSPSTEPFPESSPAVRRRGGSAGAHAGRRGARGSGGECDDAGGVSLWRAHAGQALDSRMEPMRDLALPFHSLLGSRMDGDFDASRGGGDDGYGTPSAADGQYGEYRRQLMERLAAVDPSLGSAFAHRADAAEKQAGAMPTADTLDAAANLLLFSATAAFLNGRRASPGLADVSAAPAALPPRSGPVATM